MGKNVTNTAGKHQYPRIQRRKVGRRRNQKLLPGMEAVSILFDKTILGVLTAEAASRNLALPCLLRDIIHQWLANLN